MGKEDSTENYWKGLVMYHTISLEVYFYTELKSKGKISAPKYGTINYRECGEEPSEVFAGWMRGQFRFLAA
jgi:hypothetical protein